MDVAGRIALVTGAGQGIGRALATALADAGARIVAVDIDASSAAEVARTCGGLGIGCDMTNPDAVSEMIARAQAWQGRIDILVSNAGMAKGEPDGPTSADDAHWQRSFDLHVMAHLRAARLLLPGMVARGDGALINVASAAGLLTQIGDAAYSATKHAAVSLAQSLAIEHGHQGIHVSVVCPLYVATPLLGYAEGDMPANARVLSSEEVAQSTLQGISEGRFLILPHQEASDFFIRRANDPERWLDGMQRLRAKIMADGPSDISDLHRRF
ncbi:SDR family NAD(P)-dependent oxidoreductase [Roseivivax sp. CAU 1753]